MGWENAEASDGWCHSFSAGRGWINEQALITPAMCHEHSRSKIREKHVEEGIRDYGNCVECHRSADEDEAEYIWKLKRRGLSPQDYPAYRGGDHEDDED